MKQIKYRVGDATNPIEDGDRYICHICNDQGGWGKGFVGAISRRWSEPERVYRNWMQWRKGEINEGVELPSILGKCQSVTVGPKLTVINMVAQRGYASAKNPVAVDYEALRACLRQVTKWMSWKYQKNADLFSIHMPKIGTGLGGGDWKVIEKIIQEELCKYDIQVYVYQLEWYNLFEDEPEKGIVLYDPAQLERMTF